MHKEKINRIIPFALVILVLVVGWAAAQSISNSIHAHVWRFTFVLGGTIVLLFGILVLQLEKREFNAPLLGLLTLGVALMAIGVFRPPILEIGNMKLTLEAATKKAEKATQETENTNMLTAEMTAVSLWNSSHYTDPIYGSAFMPEYAREQKKMAKILLQRVFDRDTDVIIHFLQHKRILFTPDVELKKVPREAIPEKYRVAGSLDAAKFDAISSWTSY